MGAPQVRGATGFASAGTLHRAQRGSRWGVSLQAATLRRNVAVTGPWGHDGTVASLGDMVDAYARGGRAVKSGRYAGDGAQIPFKDVRIAGFSLTVSERQDLLAFFDSLTDEGMLIDARHGDPFCRNTLADLDDCLEPVEFP